MTKLIPSGFVIPDSVKNASKLSERARSIVDYDNDDNARSIYTISSDSGSEHTICDDAQGEHISVDNAQTITDINSYCYDSDHSEENSFDDAESIIWPYQIGKIIGKYLFLHSTTFTANRNPDPGLDVDDRNIIATGTYENPVNLITPTSAHTIGPPMSAEICDVETRIPTSDETVETGPYENGLGYDASPATLHYFNQAAVHITTRELVDDFIAAQATNLAGGVLDIDQVAEAEKELANDAFFVAGPQDSFFNPPSAHILDGTYNPGHLNYTTTIAAHDKNAIPLEVDDLADPDYYLGPDATHPDDFILARIAQASPCATERISKTPSCATISSRKRAASPEPEVVAKKARTTSRGFAGQFSLMVSCKLADETSNSTEQVSFGDRRNANGTICNPAFVKCPYFHSLDWEEDSRGDADLQAMLAYARTKSELAEKVGRDESEQQMRKLCHLECAEARLTGRAVGLFRYEEGHMTVEEYVENGVCVCWEGCWCSKLCTRYGDVLCPCAQQLILEA